MQEALDNLSSLKINTENEMELMGRVAAILLMQLEKEKEQMIGCCLVGYLFDENGDINPFEEAEKFYNQTYNQNK